MEWNDSLRTCLAPYHELIGDKQTGTTFEETIRGIMGAGCLICQQIAAHSPVLAQAKKGAQRIIGLASGESTQRSELDAKHLTKKVRQGAFQHLEGGVEIVTCPVRLTYSTGVRRKEPGELVTKEL